MRKSFMAEVLFNACEKIGAELHMGLRFGANGQIIFKNGQRVSFVNCCFDINSYGSGLFARDKGLTRHVLEAEGVRMPPGQTFSLHMDQYEGWDSRLLDKQALLYAAKLGFPVMLKAADLHRGSGVYYVEQMDEMQEILQKVKQQSDSIIVEKFVSGRDFRLIVFEEEIIAGYERIPFHIIGDGYSKVGELVNVAQNRITEAGRDVNFSLLAKQISSRLTKHGYCNDDVIPNGEMITLLKTANTSTGGMPLDYSDKINPAYQDYCCKIMKILNLRFAGIDFISPDIALTPDDSYVLEVNSSPELESFSMLGISHREKIETLVERLVFSMQRGNETNEQFGASRK